MKRELLHEVAGLIKQLGEFTIDDVAVYNDVKAFKDKWTAKGYSDTPLSNGDEEVIEGAGPEGGEGDLRGKAAVEDAVLGL